MTTSDRLALAGIVLAAAIALITVALQPSGYLNATTAKVLLGGGALLCVGVVAWLFISGARSAGGPDTSVARAIDYIVNDSQAVLERPPAPYISEYGPTKGRLVHHRGVEHSDAIKQLNEALAAACLQAWGARSFDHDSERGFEAHLRPIPRSYWEHNIVHLLMSLVDTDRRAQTMHIGGHGASDYLFTKLAFSSAELKRMWPPLPLPARVSRFIRRTPRISYYPRAEPERDQHAQSAAAKLRQAPQWVTRRLRHFEEALWRPALSRWAAAIFAIVSALTWARDEFIDPAVAERLGLSTLLPHWRWEIWALLAALIMIAALFEGSLALGEASARERDAVEAKLAQFAAKRDLTFKNASFEVDHENNLVRFDLIFQNLGDELLQYRLTGISLRRTGFDIINVTPGEEVHFVARGRELQNQFALSRGFRLTPLPSSIEIGFTVEYDNVPAVRPRVFERIVKYSFASLQPLACSNQILLTREA